MNDWLEQSFSGRNLCFHNVNNKSRFIINENTIRNYFWSNKEFINFIYSLDNEVNFVSSKDSYIFINHSNDDFKKIQLPLKKHHFYINHIFFNEMYQWLIDNKIEHSFTSYKVPNEHSILCNPIKYITARYTIFIKNVDEASLFSLYWGDKI